MKIVIAPDSYKECLSSREVAATMAEAALQVYPSAEVVQIPLADGGEGTLDVLTWALDAKVHEARVSDPLGRTIDARFATLGDTGIIEVAQACGLNLLKPMERNPIIASSKGVGELIVEAFRKGCRRLIIGLGGSATCDGGTGMLAVPGVRDVLRETSVELLCDVDNPFTGPDGAARVFAPQKGASPADVEILESRMAELAREIAAETGVDVSSIPGAGAAGGLGGALIAYADAEMTSGVDKVMLYTHFDAAIRDADIVFTGEGRSDFQTLNGKVPYGVLRHCRGKKVALLSGMVDASAMGALYGAGFWAVRAVTPEDMPTVVAMDPEIAKQNIFSAVIRALS